MVTSAAKAAQVQSAGFLGSIARWAILILALITALAHLGIAPAFMQILFTGLVAMLALAGGLAFGLGGKEAASRFLENPKRNLKSQVTPIVELCKKNPSLLAGRGFSSDLTSFLLHIYYPNLNMFANKNTKKR